MSDNIEEKKLREELAKKLGVEFCTPEEIDDEIEAAQVDLAKSKESELKKVQVTLTPSDIIEACNDAISKMSSNNPHKRLLFICADFIRILCERCMKAETELATFKDPKRVN